MDAETFERHFKSALEEILSRLKMDKRKQNASDDIPGFVSMIKIDVIPLFNQVLFTEKNISKRTSWWDEWLQYEQYWSEFVMV